MLLRHEEERSPGADAVRAEQSVDGSAQIDGELGMTATELAQAGDFAGSAACSLRPAGWRRRVRQRLALATGQSNRSLIKPSRSRIDQTIPSGTATNSLRRGIQPHPAPKRHVVAQISSKLRHSLT